MFALTKSCVCRRGVLLSGEYWDLVCPGPSVSSFEYVEAVPQVLVGVASLLVAS